MPNLFPCVGAQSAVVRQHLRTPLLSGLLILVISISGCSNGRRADSGDAPSQPVFARVGPPSFRAVTLDARSEPAPGTLERLHDLGVTHLAVIPYGFQPSHDTPEIRLNLDARWYSESAPGIHDLARKTDSLGMGLVIKPQLWLGGYEEGTPSWSADIMMTSEADWQAWEANYRQLLLHYADLANEVDAALLVIGTELGKAAEARPDFWRSLIADVRERYDGPLTYAGNWYDDYEIVTFWDALDCVGVQAYFPLTKRNDPSLETLLRAWTSHRNAIQRLHERTGRPIMFTELGYRSVPYAAAEPWRWASREEVGQVEADEALQARLYQAAFETFWKEPWFDGVILWKWQGSPSRRAGRRALDFTPQDKAAETVIAEWFGAG
ncbi:MAG: glycoside hydrolase family 113 [Rhodothermales bacterium]